MTSEKPLAATPVEAIVSHVVPYSMGELFEGSFGLACGLCGKQANARLAPEGLEIDDRMVMSFGEGTASGGVEAPLVRLRWTNDKRKKPTPPMFCAYCPFCGRKKS